MKIYVYPVLLSSFFLLASLPTNAQKLAVVPYVSGINKPIDIKNCGDDRLFIVDQAGLVRIINADNTLRPTPFLDISSKIYSGTDEEGFLGMVFSPDYKSDGKFYVYYVANISSQVTLVVEQYNVSAADSNIADASSALTILTQAQPTINDLGGNMMFGKDKYLYINMGDGGVRNNGQSRTTFLGKILRIDVSNSSVAQPYVVPASNPYVSDATGLKKEIWAYGMRNPWRSSVDRLTGDLWIADVGQDSLEEIDYQAVNAAGGRNYGWQTMEGTACFNPPTGCNTTGITLPLYEYAHSYGATIIGGYRYSSAQSKSLFGTYIYGDFTSKWVDGIKQSGGVMAGSVNHLITAAQATGNPICFGEDRYGDQYILFYGDGTVYKLQDTSYLRRPKGYFTPVDEGTGSFLFQGLEGRNLTYQWLRNNAIIEGATSPDYTTSSPGTYALVVTNTLGFSDTSDAYSLAPLPLNLVSFTAQKVSAGRVKLQWKTDSERNISGFTILKEQNNEATFSSIAFVNSKSINGVSNSELDYTYTDSSALTSSTIFYRLRIDNTDGTYAYSDIRTITAGGNINTYTFYPNPAKGQVQLYLDNFTQPVLLVIYDNSGKKVKEQTVNQQNTTIQLPVSKGIYIMQVSDKDGGNVVRRKLVIQ